MCIDYRSTGELQLKALIIKKGQKKKKNWKRIFFILSLQVKQPGGIIYKCSLCVQIHARRIFKCMFLNFSVSELLLEPPERGHFLTCLFNITEYFSKKKNNRKGPGKCEDFCILYLLMAIFYLKINCELFQTWSCVTADFSHVQDKIHVTEHYSHKPVLFDKAFM